MLLEGNATRQESAAREATILPEAMGEDKTSTSRVVCK